VTSSTLSVKFTADLDSPSQNSFLSPPSPVALKESHCFCTDPPHRVVCFDTCRNFLTHPPQQDPLNAPPSSFWTKDFFLSSSFFPILKIRFLPRRLFASPVPQKSASIFLFPSPTLDESPAPYLRPAEAFTLGFQIPPPPPLLYESGPFPSTPSENPG